MTVACIQITYRYRNRYPGQECLFPGQVTVWFVVNVPDCFDKPLVCFPCQMFLSKKQKAATKKDILPYVECFSEASVFGSYVY